MKNIVSLFLLLSSFTAYGQKHIKESIYCEYLRDSITFEAWLPENWTPNTTSTTIYTFSYGASDGQFISEQINYLNKLRISTLPSTIVISISADMNLMGYNYETGLLTEKGSKTMDCIRHKIMPLVEKKYKSSKFRVYIGQSYGASYGNHLFQYMPELFSAYIIISPEKIAPQQPSFEITTRLTEFYKNNKKYFYIASGALDIPRRQEYAKEVFEKIKNIDSSKVAFKFDNINNANHNNSLAIALPTALEFIYQDYYRFPELDNRNSVFKLVKKYEENIAGIFGVPVDKNSFPIYNFFLTKIWQEQDTASMVEAIDFFITKNSSVRQLRDFAYFSNVVGLTEKSKGLYQLAIETGHSSEQTPNFYPAYLITAYREYALLVEDPKDGWELLQKAEQICLKYKNSIRNDYFPNIYFYLGRYAADKNINVKTGLHYLLQYQELQKENIILNQFNLDLVYYYIGYSYFLLNKNDNAKEYLTKSLELNKQNVKAKQMLETMRK